MKNAKADAFENARNALRWIDFRFIEADENALYVYIFAILKELNKVIACKQQLVYAHTFLL